MKGGMILLGILLLAASLFGAKMLFDQSSTPDPKSKTAADVNQVPDKVLCWGYFDVAKGVAPLNPRQFGDILEVKAENTWVKEGEVLLRVDNRLAKLKVEEAEADVKAGTQQVAEAQHLTKFYELQRQQQEAAIRALGHEITTLELKRDRELLPLDNGRLAETIKKFYVEGLAQLGEKKKSEQAKLAQLQLQDANLKITQAEADLEAKNVRLKQAQEMLKYFQIVAPSNGTILRVHVHQGETMGPNPLKPALEFLPDGEIVVKAEVLQEWGRYIDEKKKQEVEIEDDIYQGPKWTGTVKSVSKWYAPQRSAVLEPFRYNDVRTLECIISVKDATGSRNGQRVRAKIKIAQ